MYTEQITLVIGSEYARSCLAADRYDKLSAAEQRRQEQHRVGSRLARVRRSIGRRRVRVARLLHLH